MDTDADLNELQPILLFLKCRTPQAWLEQASENLELLLLDHAHCEKKAASTALAFIYRYPHHPTLIYRMSRIAREELRHFEQVLKLMEGRGLVFKHLPPARYADGLRQEARTHEPARLIDHLIMGAIVEARSCERFAALLPYLPEDIAKFYRGLLASEARHFEVYLNLAKDIAQEGLIARIEQLVEVEKNLVLSPDARFRFHSGISYTED